jgi:tetratricopeptide (TPR) repeat protein
MSITDNYFEEGVKAYQNGDYPAASAAFLKVLDSEPYSSETLLNLGNVYFKQDHPDDAVEIWKKTIQTNPMESKAYLNLGNYYYSQKDYNKAVDYWEIFQKIEPTHTNINLNLGLAYESTNQLQKAFQCYNNFLRISTGAEKAKLKQRLSEAGRVADHNLKQAEILMKYGRLQEARTAFEMSVRLVPLDPKSYKHYASVLYHLQNYPDACEWYEKAHASMPEDTSILINLGVIYEKLEKPFLALWAYDMAIKRVPNGISKKVKDRAQAIWENQGKALLSETRQKVQTNITMQNYKEAERLIKRVYEVYQFHNEEKLINELKETIDFLRGRKDPKKQAAVIAYALAEDYRINGQYEKAIAFYDRYLQYMPDGEKVQEIQEKRQQIEKVISAVIGGLLSAPEQNAA